MCFTLRPLSESNMMTDIDDLKEDFQKNALVGHVNDNDGSDIDDLKEDCENDPLDGHGDDSDTSALKYVALPTSNTAKEVVALSSTTSLPTVERYDIRKNGTTVGGSIQITNGSNVQCNTPTEIADDTANLQLRKEGEKNLYLTNQEVPVRSPSSIAHERSYADRYSYFFGDGIADCGDDDLLSIMTTEWERDNAKSNHSHRTASPSASSDSASSTGNCIVPIDDQGQTYADYDDILSDDGISVRSISDTVQNLKERLLVAESTKLELLKELDQRNPFKILSSAERETASYDESCHCRCGCAEDGVSFTSRNGARELFSLFSQSRYDTCNRKRNCSSPCVNKKGNGIIQYSRKEKRRRVVEKLKDANENLRNTINQMRADINQAEKELKAVKSENVQLKKDAMRTETKLRQSFIDKLMECDDRWRKSEAEKLDLKQKYEDELKSRYVHSSL